MVYEGVGPATDPCRPEACFWCSFPDDAILATWEELATRWVLDLPGVAGKIVSRVYVRNWYCKERYAAVFFNDLAACAQRRGEGYFQH